MIQHKLILITPYDMYENMPKTPIPFLQPLSPPPPPPQVQSQWPL